MSPTRCPALLVSAPASGQGKTTVTAAVARRARREGRRVQVFKTGPDFLDPMLLERASGRPVYNLDLWMGGEQHCRALLHEAALSSDLILIEGVMGLFDGEPSSADLAALLQIPILAVIDAAAMAQTFGAVAHGLQHYRPALPFHGVVANRVGSAGHAKMLAAALPREVHLLGWLPSDAAMALPERHLGLQQPDEIAQLDARLDAAASALELVESGLRDIAALPFAAVETATLPRLLANIRIAVARDAAFSFLYRSNLDLLQALGAKLSFFSPLTAYALPAADAVYLPGGYPELYAAQLATNDALHQALRRHHAAGLPIVAECGGMMLLFDALIDGGGSRHRMAGVLQGESQMQPRLQALALQAVDLGAGTLRGHSFHHSRLASALVPFAQGVTQHGTPGEPVFCDRRLVASYLHYYFPSNPLAAAALFRP
jgi:cobyrinic acid a,c-diamide synthase